MRRYLIIALAFLSGLIVFLLTLYILRRFANKNKNFYALISGLITFIAVLLICFLYLEKQSANTTYEYIPPKLMNGKIQQGEFKKNFNSKYEKNLSR